jgi:hypothetical protein
MPHVSGEFEPTGALPILGGLRSISAMGPKADITAVIELVCFVPIADIRLSAIA